MTLAALIKTDRDDVFLQTDDFAVTGTYKPENKSDDVTLTVLLEEEGQLVQSDHTVDEQLTALIYIGRDPDSDKGGVANVKPGDVFIVDVAHDPDATKWTFMGDIIELNSAGGWYRFTSTTVRQIGTQQRLR